jgi:hypothetical protein
MLASCVLAMYSHTTNPGLIYLCNIMAGSIVLIASGGLILLCLVLSSATTQSLFCLFCCDTAHHTIAADKGYGTSGEAGGASSSQEPHELTACA